MNIVTELAEWRSIRAGLSHQTVGFVPTMGNLHAGHLSLCDRARLENDVTVASIFINPTQFNQASDFEHYPRTLVADQALLEAHQVDYLFCPQSEAMYPDHFEVQLTETVLSQDLEGEYRPGHFNGMLTVVLKLFNLVMPTKAYFGEKDYQQLLLAKKMSEALFLPCEVIGCETKRAPDGLALSSRNNRLTEAAREMAANFPLLLHSPLPNELVIMLLSEMGFKVDYVSEKWGRRLGAVYLDQVRLIDNIAIDILE